ncbi:hypothetical protein [Oryzobacter telluris]|uniref:hypothetical protein n=1 Tax=Oryzobacter telluris TaxID=3149179 RepID=UPI00370D8819
MTDTPSRRLRPPTMVGLAVVALVPLIVLRLRLLPVDDPDSYWHVLSGQNVWRTHDVVVDDPFGRFSTNTWVQLDWLSDLTMSGLFAVGGYPAISWLFSVLGIVLFALLYLSCRRHAGVLAAAFVAVAAWIGTYASQSYRPQTVSFVLLAVFVTVWLRVAHRGGRTPWWLVALTYLWACCHGLWFLGPLVGLVVVVGLALERARPARELLVLSAIPVLGVLVAAVTPIGPRLLTLPFTVNAYAEFVTEWRPPDLHEPYAAVTVGLLALTAVGWARGGRRVPWTHVLLWGMALGWALLYARTVAIGAVVVAPLAAGALQTLLPLPEEPAAARADRRLVPAAAVFATLLAALLASSVAPRPAAVPLGLDGAIDGLEQGTVVINDDAVGGWLLLEHPGVSPVIDTRTYLFDVPYIRRYIGARGAVGDWESFVATTGAKVALLREGEPLVAALPDALGWRVVARADGYVLLSADAR